ncbi:hypothetical protein PQ469_06420 [Mucilaginibacter sp. KACC 22773]|uniref:hypothetical protein n=1 Tax=Mucilaginibacter sp. KACC 22773 TaxID=3025671 RepID=UPI0023654761|nr:hypothetical protein [Mucilaginibacter sp. KACC 22773]WDF79639.1 hypothetical protein PQ469_06420 [Mucilaginibacter sp. KACC 22773]
MTKKHYPLFLLMMLIFGMMQVKAQTSLNDIKATLQSPYFEKLYSNTYYSLLDRMRKDGFLPESLTGAYEGMYCRTTGAMVSLLIETGRLKEAELNIKCVLDATTQNHMERIPHVIGIKDNKYTIISDEHQIDGQAHVLLAWARLALKRGHTNFEDKTWPLVSTIMKRTCDRTFFQHGWWSVEPGLIRNISFEHSREGRRWDVWDLLTQSFVGAALNDMATVAERRSETKLAADWRKKMEILQQGIRKNLTTVRNSDTTYLEMRLPDSNGGTPYLGMGWVTLSPVAAQWEGLNHQVMRNTAKAMQQGMLKKTNGLAWMPTDSYPDGTVSNEIIGKGQAWEMEFARTEKDYNRIKAILDLIKIVNAPKPVYMEGGWLDGNGHKQSEKISDTDLAAMNNAVWKTKDAGNGEQCAWWCWAMARLRVAAGLPAEPARVK